MGTGITNPAEEYFKDGVWGWASTLWEKLVSSGGILYNAAHGWDGTTWRKQPLMLGYSDTWSEVATGVAAGAGDAVATSVAVAPNYIYVVLAVSAYHNAGVNKQVAIRILGGLGTAWIVWDTSVAHLQRVFWNGAIVLKEGEQVQTTVYAPGAGKATQMDIRGYEMSITE